LLADSGKNPPVGPIIELYGAGFLRIYLKNAPPAGDHLMSGALAEMRYTDDSIGAVVMVMSPL